MRESYTMKILTCLFLYQILQFKSTYRGSIVNMLQWNIINKSNSTWERNRRGRDQLLCLLPHQRMAKKWPGAKATLKILHPWVARRSKEFEFQGSAAKMTKKFRCQVSKCLAETGTETGSGNASRFSRIPCRKPETATSIRPSTFSHTGKKFLSEKLRHSFVRTVVENRGSGPSEPRW